MNSHSIIVMSYVWPLFAVGMVVVGAGFILVAIHEFDSKEYPSEDPAPVCVRVTDGFILGAPDSYLPPGCPSDAEEVVPPVVDAEMVTLYTVQALKETGLISAIFGIGVGFLIAAFMMFVTRKGSPNGT